MTPGVTLWESEVKFLDKRQGVNFTCDMRDLAFSSFAFSTWFVIPFTKQKVCMLCMMSAA